MQRRRVHKHNYEPALLGQGSTDIRYQSHCLQAGRQSGRLFALGLCLSVYYTIFFLLLFSRLKLTSVFLQLQGEKERGGEEAMKMAIKTFHTRDQYIGCWPWETLLFTSAGMGKENRWNKHSSQIHAVQLSIQGSSMGTPPENQTHSANTAELIVCRRRSVRP